MSTMLSTQNPERAAELQEGGAAAAAAEIAETGGLAEEAAVAMPEPVSQEGMPEIGQFVHYQPRRGDVRRGRTRVPALVIWKYPDTRLLQLAVYYDATDIHDQDRIPEAVGDERGWLLISGANGLTDADRFNVNAARQEVARLRSDVAEVRAILLGEFQAPERSILSMLDDVDSRVDGLIAKTSIPDARAVAKKTAAKKKPKRGK